MQSISGKTYILGKKIGSGTYGKVYEATRSDNNKKYALKIFYKENPDIELGVLREISILKILQNNNSGIINLEDIILFDKDGQKNIAIVMKKYNKDLHTAITDNLLTSDLRHRITRKLLKSLYFLHENGIIHRDIKPENILLDDNMNPIFADFTLAKVFIGPCKQGTHTGKIATATYRAPEIVNKDSYNLSADMWSLGVVLYEMFTKKRLEFNTDQNALSYLARQIPKFKNNLIGKLVEGLLREDPNDRFSAKQALEIYDNIEIPKIKKIWSGINSYNISGDINTLCQYFDADKKITYYAAQIYTERTGCSFQAAVELACKFYETTLCEYESDDYPEEEFLILQEMKYNLYV